MQQFRQEAENVLQAKLMHSLPRAAMSKLS